MVGTSRTQIRELASEDGGPCVSLHLPTHRAGNEIRQDPIRLQNLLSIAAERLGKNGEDGLLDPVRELVADDSFWRHQTDGLALFSSSAGFRRVQLPYAVDELCEVGNRFIIKPLLRAVTGDGRFFVLALSQHKVRVLEATRHTAHELSIDGMPHSLEEALGHEEKERVPLSYHSGTPSQRAGRRDAVFHGQGVATDLKKDEVLRFCRIVDERLLGAVERTVPLVLAAVDWVGGIYRDVSKHPTIIEETVEGNPDMLSANDVAQRAFPLVTPRLREAERHAAERLSVGLHHGLGSADVDAIVQAAFDGRVEALFVAVDRVAWGQFDPQTRRVQLHHRRGNGDVDLVNLAAALTLCHDGDVYASMPKEFEPGAAAALFRY